MYQNKDFEYEYTTVGSANQQSLPPPTFRSSRPQSNMQGNIFDNNYLKNFEHPRRSLDQQPFKLTPNISHVRSETTFTNTLLQEELDLPETLISLEQKINEEILVLREDKLTLMEEYNQVIQGRFKVQRELNKAKKKFSTFCSQSSTHGQSNEQKQCLTSQKNCQALICSSITKQDLHIMQRIENLQFAIMDMQQQIQKDKANKQDLYGGSQIKSQIFQPQNIDKEMQKGEQFNQLTKLRQKKQKLLSLIINQTEKQELKNCLLSLVASNQQLQAVIDLHIYTQTHQVQILHKKISKEEQDKQMLLEDLITIKSKSKHLQIENSQLRKALSYFRF